MSEIYAKAPNSNTAINMNASTPKRKQTRKASTEVLAPITSHEFRIMNCLPGVVERDA